MADKLKGWALIKAALRNRKTAAMLTPAFAKNRAPGTAVSPEDSLTAELSDRLVRGAATAFVSVGLERPGELVV